MGRLYIFKMESLQCRQLPCPQHPSAPPQLCPDSTLSPGLISLPSHAPIPGFMQPGWMFNQDNACARKQCSFLLLFWSFFSPQPIWFSARLLMGQAGPPCMVPAAGMCQEHIAGRGQSGTAHFGNTLSCSFCRGMILKSQLDLFVFSEMIYTLFDSSCCLTFLILRPLSFLWKNVRYFQSDGS